MNLIRISVLLLSFGSALAQAFELADAPAEDPLAPAMARCLKDKPCNAAVEQMIPQVAKDAHLSAAETRRLIDKCDANDSAKGACLRLYLGSLDAKMKRVTDHLLESAATDCRKQVADARKAWRFRIDNACEAASGEAAGAFARIADCRALALQRRIDKLGRLTSCVPCAPCIDP
jgi:hypothetical protein